jgi:hypothetical protein
MIFGEAVEQVLLNDADVVTESMRCTSYAEQDSWVIKFLARRSLVSTYTALRIDGPRLEA